jgi:hypothetical protein
VNDPAHQKGAVAVLELRQITMIFAIECVIWRTEVGIASLIRAPVVMMSALGPRPTLAACEQRVR